MGDDDWTAPLPVRRVQRSDDAMLGDGQWPATRCHAAIVPDQLPLL